MWDSLLCLAPSLLPLLLAALLRWPSLRARLEASSTWATQILWRGACWVLELPPPSPGEQDDGRPAAAEPRLVCKPTALAQHLLLHCRALLRAPPAAWPRGDPHLQTFSGLLWPAEGAAGGGQVHFTRDHLLLGDGGIVALDWAMGLKEEPPVGAKCKQQPGVCRCSSGSPSILLLIPNHLGVVTPHLRHMCSLALHQGFSPVVFHRRGQGGCPLTTPHYQEFGDPRDLMQAVAYLRSRYPSATLLAVSEGSGSGLLLSYLGECGSSSYLTAAACISPVLHGQLWFETPLPPLYHWAMLFYRKLQISRYANALSSVMDVSRLLGCRSLRDMEELMFCGPSKPAAAPGGGQSRPEAAPGGGQSRAEAAPGVGQSRAEAAPGVGQSRPEAAKDWEAYWARNEPLRDADEVAVPVLCLRSADDPLVPATSDLPTSLFRNSPYFLLALTAHGGHCGFARTSKGGSWSHEVVLEYFRAVSDFMKVEERRGIGSGRWAQGSEVSGQQAQGWRHRSGSVLARRRRALQATRRVRHLTYQPTQGELTEDLFTWNRSYTR